MPTEKAKRLGSLVEWGHGQEPGRRRAGPEGRARDLASQDGGGPRERPARRAAPHPLPALPPQGPALHAGRRVCEVRLVAPPGPAVTRQATRP